VSDGDEPNKLPEVGSAKTGVEISALSSPEGGGQFFLKLSLERVALLASWFSLYFKGEITVGLIAGPTGFAGTLFLVRRWLVEDPLTLATFSLLLMSSLDVVGFEDTPDACLAMRGGGSVGSLGVGCAEI